MYSCLYVWKQEYIRHGGKIYSESNQGQGEKQWHNVLMYSWWKPAILAMHSRDHMRSPLPLVTCSDVQLTFRCRFVGYGVRGKNRDVLQNENCNFRKGPGTRCEKNGACSRISTRKFVWTALILRERIFRFEIGLSWGESSGSAGSERWFSWFFPFNWICQHFFSIEIWTSVMFSWSTFGLCWVACRPWQKKRALKFALKCPKALKLASSFIDV